MIRSITTPSSESHACGGKGVRMGRGGDVCVCGGGGGVRGGGLSWVGGQLAVLRELLTASERTDELQMLRSWCHSSNTCV